MRFQHRLELVERLEAVKGRDELAFAVLEIALPEGFEGAHLPDGRLHFGGAAAPGLAGDILAVDQEVGDAALAAGTQRVLVLPLGAGDRRAAVEPAILAPAGPLRQRRAEARPHDDDDDVGRRRRDDAVLEMPRGEQRLLLPEHRDQVEEAGEIALQPPEHDRRAAPLVVDVAR